MLKSLHFDRLKIVSIVSCLVALKLINVGPS